MTRIDKARFIVVRGGKGDNLTHYEIRESDVASMPNVCYGDLIPLRRWMKSAKKGDLYVLPKLVIVCAR
jgi:hypothetical protein